MNFKINLSEIKIDGGTQSRVAIDPQVVADYAEAYKVGIRFPDISLFFDGATYWLVDGFHRYHAAKAAGKTSISAEKRDGTQREAVLYACGANSDHGLRRSNEDKRKAVLTLLEDDEWKSWSNVKIAEACAVSASLVDRIRHEAASSHGGKIEPVRKVERGGKIYTQNTANVGQPKASAQKPETSKSSTGSTVDPSASLAPDDTFEGDDPLDQLEATLKENETLRKTVEKLSATDQGAALAKALAAQAYAEDQQGKAMNQAAMYQKEVKAWQSWWAKVVVMVHIEKRSDLLGWIKARL